VLQILMISFINSNKDSRLLRCRTSHQIAVYPYLRSQQSLESTTEHFLGVKLRINSRPMSPSVCFGFQPCSTEPLNCFEGDTAGAVKWLTTPRRALENLSPLAYCRTGHGAREVENLIGRLEEGVF